MQARTPALRSIIRPDEDVTDWFRNQVNAAGRRQLPDADQQGPAEYIGAPAEPLGSRHSKSD
jgi:hypothetical protein